MARAHGVSLWRVQCALSAAAVVVLPDIDTLGVHRLRIDDGRHRPGRFYSDEAGSGKRYEPLITTSFRLSTGQVLDVVVGRAMASASGQG